VIPAATRYARASDVEHAVELLAEPDAKAIAGGQSLIPVMKLRIARPSVVVDISRLDLRGIEERDGAVHVGPLSTWAELATPSIFERPDLAAIADCARGIGDVQVRKLGTNGGSLVHADPASDMPAVLLALDTRVGVQGAGGTRELTVSELLVGPFMTSLGQQDIVTDVVVPIPEPGSGSAYVSVEHPASGFALAGAAALVGPSGERVALTGVGSTPFLLPDGDVREAISTSEIFGDRFAAKEYRQALAETVATRALGQARARAEESR
jgi:carbon-monoxide dehydrogenase medium subunit